MLRKIRIALASIFFVGITLLFIGIGQEWWGWMAKLQFLPAALGLNVAVLVGLILVTLVFGRVYCSIICPLGIYQDIVNWISSKRKGKKNRFSFKKEMKWLRYGIFGLYILAIIAGVQIIIALLAPYSAYGRIVSSIVNPQGWAVPVIAAVTVIAVTVLAWIGGRTYCNTICPVGTILSFFSRFAMFRPMIDAQMCKSCRSCEKKCKASCIDVDTKTIDYSRCIGCFDCLESCSLGGVHYKFAYCKDKKESESKPQETDNSRRAFLGATAFLGTALASKAQTKLDGGLAPIIDKEKPARKERLVPFGAISIKNFYDKCTACQLCVSNCPNNVLRPSTDLEHLMQPEMSYENGYCRPECTICSQVCPAGAILEITPEEKTTIQIGKAVVNYDLCVVNRDDVSCGNCAYHCPASAITMVPKDSSDPHSRLIPSVIESRCIGCGACENLCPSRPISAIHVDGLKVHITTS